MTRLIIEAEHGDHWEPLAVPDMTADMPPGTFTTHGGEVLMFGWYEGNGPSVWRMEGSHHLIEHGALRVTNADAVTVLSDLMEPFEFTWNAGGSPMRVRIRRTP